MINAVVNRLCRRRSLGQTARPQPRTAARQLARAELDQRQQAFATSWRDQHPRETYGRLTVAGREHTELAAAREDVRRALETIARLAGSADPTVARTAGSAQRAVVVGLLPELPASDRPSRQADPAAARPRRAFDLVERSLGAVRASLVIVPGGLWHALIPIWTFLGLLLAVVAAGMLANGEIGWAAAVLMVRQFGSAIMPPAYPIGPYNRHKAAISWRVCVIGHVADAVAVGGVALIVVQNSGPIMSLLAVLAVVATLAGTIFRLAAFQDGDFAGRLVLERAFRSSWVALFVTLEALFGPAFGQLVFLGAAAAGPVVYSCFELWRVHRRHDAVLSRREDLTDSDRLYEAVCEISPGVAPPRRFADG